GSITANGLIATATTASTTRETGRTDDADRAGRPQKRPPGGIYVVRRRPVALDIFCHTLSGFSDGINLSERYVCLLLEYCLEYMELITKWRSGRTGAEFRSDRADLENPRRGYLLHVVENVPSVFDHDRFRYNHTALSAIRSRIRDLPASSTGWSTVSSPRGGWPTSVFGCSVCRSPRGSVGRYRAAVRDLRSRSRSLFSVSSASGSAFSR